jgi:hypothetical protein
MLVVAYPKSWSHTLNSTYKKTRLKCIVYSVNFSVFCRFTYSHMIRPSVYSYFGMSVHALAQPSNHRNFFVTIPEFLHENVTSTFGVCRVTTVIMLLFCCPRAYFILLLIVILVNYSLLLLGPMFPTWCLWGLRSGKPPRMAKPRCINFIIFGIQGLGVTKKQNMIHNVYN